TTMPSECCGSCGTFPFLSRSSSWTTRFSSANRSCPVSCAWRCARVVRSSVPPDRREVAKRWLRWATEDLMLAEHTAADEELVARGACIWAHQAAEKAIKALLIARDVDPPKLHDLDRLVAQ